ncbi:Lar family restriction alleviation protein [Pectobacterium versatile]|uniref:Lar family restriction alleviation protein n=1 Tax=Pectobacterium versatile TaxID=2488639 RepID=UPI000CFFCCAB|nr:Lar family restriction alleviation protein [Pectobacterium versatile]PRI19456.1 hypothetical protein BZY99_13030 [Pectobacterium versatile]
MHENLNPCPFCGGSAVFDFDMHEISCNGCGITIKTDYVGSDDRGVAVIRAWNSRHKNQSQINQQELLDALEALVDLTSAFDDDSSEFKMARAAIAKTKAGHHNYA